jgi:hypothetical protein
VSERYPYVILSKTLDCALCCGCGAFRDSLFSLDRKVANSDQWRSLIISGLLYIHSWSCTLIPNGSRAALLEIERGEEEREISTSTPTRDRDRERRGEEEREISTSTLLPPFTIWYIAIRRKRLPAQ